MTTFTPQMELLHNNYGWCGLCSECVGGKLYKQHIAELTSTITTDWCSHCDYIENYKTDYNHICPIHKTQNIKKQHHTGNGKPKGIFAGTLTMSPKWDTNEEEMVSAIKKIMRQKTTPVKRYVWYLEYTKENVPHIHFIYETVKGGRITQQTFKRQWKWWDESTPCGSGHVGGYHKHCAKEDDYLEYISKDKGRHENKWTI